MLDVLGVFLLLVSLSTMWKSFPVALKSNSSPQQDGQFELLFISIEWAMYETFMLNVKRFKQNHYTKIRSNECPHPPSCVPIHTVPAVSPNIRVKTSSVQSPTLPHSDNIQLREQ